MEQSRAPLLEGFTDDFFASLERDMQTIDLQKIASDALAGILTIEAEDGAARTYEQIKQETEVFFANPLVAENMMMLSMLSEQYADFCAGHGFDESSTINEGSLQSVYAVGNRSRADGHNPNHSHGHSRSRKNESKHTASSKKEKKKAPANFYAMLDKYFKSTKLLGSHM